jgi:hypothetical protein
MEPPVPALPVVPLAPALPVDPPRPPDPVSVPGSAPQASTKQNNTANFGDLDMPR